MLKANKPRDGCDGCDGKSDTVKPTVAIVAIVAEEGRQYDLPRPPSPSKNPQSLRWMWAKDYAQELSANKLLPTPVLRFVSSLQTAKPAEASAEAAYPLGEPTILCSRRMKVS